MACRALSGQDYAMNDTVEDEMSRKEVGEGEGSRRSQTQGERGLIENQRQKNSIEQEVHATSSPVQLRERLRIATCYSRAPLPATTITTFSG